MVAADHHAVAVVARAHALGQAVWREALDVAAAELRGVDLPAAGDEHQRDVVLLGDLDGRVDDVEAHHPDADLRARPGVGLRGERDEPRVAVGAVRKRDHTIPAHSVRPNCSTKR